MNMEIKARDLIAAGWHEGRRLGAALRRARDLESTGLARADVLTALESEFPKQLPVILPRYEPAPLTEAIEAETPEEAANVAVARQRMTELLHVPVVKRGVIMPDACPSGGGRATIPVGGGIEVENAIIPGAHSADICCSMFATFFPANHPIGEMMDHLQKTTHFGAGGPAGMFAAILEAMTAVRTELALPESIEEQRREAWMRRVIRETQRDVLGPIAVVCGAWHAPALANPPKVSADNEVLKALPKCRVGATWVPWTFQRLCFASGYGAGIESPGWYEHLWKHRRDPQITARWLARVGQLLRRRDLDASTAQVIDGVRLAEHLAAFRGRAIPGLSEMNEAALAVFCHGDRAPLRLVQSELIVGDRLGAVPEGIARVPLQQDIEATQKRLRLKPAASQAVLELDLREPTALERSHFLHRLVLLNVPWGRKQTKTMGKGTFRETWQLEWKPEFAVAIIDAARFGNTVALAATGAVAANSKRADLETLSRLLESVLLADLAGASAALLQRISAEAAQSSDVLRLVRATPPLAQLARYGSVRQTDAAAVTQILDGFCARVHAGFRAATSGIDDDAAAEWRKAVLDYQGALALIESPRLDEWRSLLRKLLDHAATPALLAGTAARLLLDAGELPPPQAADALDLALSRGEDPARGAAWVEGFLAGQGTVLVHDPNLLPLLADWVAGLAEEAFLAVLPLVRRTFATFESAERTKIAQRLGRARSPGGAARESETEWTLDEQRVRSVLPVVGLLLGKPFAAEKSP